MHYARQSRGQELGGPEHLARKHRSVTRDGDVMIFAPAHELCTPGRQWIGEHRLVLFEKIGPGEHACHWCGVLVRWSRHRARDELVVDHLDRDVGNNAPDNLEPSCSRCNLSNVGRVEEMRTLGGSVVAYVRGPLSGGWKRYAEPVVLEAVAEEGKVEE